MSERPDLAELTERVADWYSELTLARATTVVELGDRVWALLTPEYPRSYAHNAILVRRDPGAEQLVAWGDEVLGGHGLEHRYVVAMCDLAPGTRDGLVAAGLGVEPEVHMARELPGAPYPGPDVVVEHVAEDDVRSFEARLWREEWLPDAEPETVRQLVGRRVTYPRSGEMLAFVVRDPAVRADGDADPSGDLAAVLDLCVAGWAAEIDGVTTLGGARGKGYGDALLARAVVEATARGCGYAVLTALSDDWPRQWYARRGFVELGPAWVATRTPANH